MNKIQKILWSIFSGAICMIYKPSYGVYDPGIGNKQYTNYSVVWELYSSVLIGPAGKCSDPSVRNPIITSYCTTISGKHPGTSCVNEYSNGGTDSVLRASVYNIDANAIDGENTCAEYQWHSGSRCYDCHSNIPLPNGIRPQLSQLVGPYNKITYAPHIGTKRQDDINIYVNTCSNLNPDGNLIDNAGNDYFQVYRTKATEVTRSIGRAYTDCYYNPYGPKHTDDTGTYSYKDTACEYTE